MPVFPVSAPVDSQGCFPISPADWRHLKKALRLGIGEIFEIYLPDGVRAEAELAGEAGNYYGRVKRLLDITAPPPLPLWLGIGVIRSARLEWAVEKLTELGLTRLSLLGLRQAHHSNPVHFSSNKINRLINISKESLKQCERITSIRIDPTLSLNAFLSQIEKEAAGAQKIILQERSAAPHLRKILSSDAKLYVILVGPEGGFSQEESEAARAHGFETASLGAAVLRSETAALYAACAVDLQISSKRMAP